MFYLLEAIDPFCQALGSLFSSHVLLRGSKVAARVTLLFLS